MAKGKSRVRTVSVGIRVPIGIYETMLKILDRKKWWARQNSYIIEAIHEKNQRHLAEERESEKNNEGEKGLSSGAS